MAGTRPAHLSSTVALEVRARESKNSASWSYFEVAQGEDLPPNTSILETPFRAIQGKESGPSRGLQDQVAGLGTSSWHGDPVTWAGTESWVRGPSCGSLDLTWALGRMKIVESSLLPTVMCSSPWAWPPSWATLLPWLSGDTRSLVVFPTAATRLRAHCPERLRPAHLRQGTPTSQGHWRDGCSTNKATRPSTQSPSPIKP